MSQLSLLGSVSQEVTPSTSERQTFFMWVGRNPTARGEYYHFYWQDRVGEQNKPVTKNRYIRGSRVGTDLGEERKRMVEGWISEAMHPLEICQKLELIPRSTRKSRHPDWGAVGAESIAQICN